MQNELDQYFLGGLFKGISKLVGGIPIIGGIAKGVVNTVGGALGNDMRPDEEIAREAAQGLNYSKAFQNFNTALDLTSTIGNAISGAQQNIDEQKELQKARYDTMNIGVNPNSRGVNNVPIYYKNGGDANMTSAKAKKILKDGVINGQPITDKQRRYFAYLAWGGNNTPEMQLGGNLLYLDGMKRNLSDIHDSFNLGKAPTKIEQAQINANNALVKKVLPKVFGNLDGVKGKEMQIPQSAQQQTFQSTPQASQFNPQQIKDTVGGIKSIIDMFKKKPLDGGSFGSFGANGAGGGGVGIGSNMAQYGGPQSSYVQSYQSPQTFNTGLGGFVDGFLPQPPQKEEKKDDGMGGLGGLVNLAVKVLPFILQDGGQAPRYNINNTGYLPEYTTSDNEYNIIPNNTITMNGVPHDIMAYGDDGSKKLLKSNSGKHKFKGAKNVLEIPVRQNGGDLQQAMSYKIGQELDLSLEEIKKLEKLGYGIKRI